MELYEIKLDILYYGVKLTDKCFDSLKKGIDGNVFKNDYITTKGLFLRLNNEVYVNAPVVSESKYTIDYDDNKYSLFKNGDYITNLIIMQPADFALNNERLESGELLTSLINVHGDRLRLQPIAGCAFKCKFCDLNKIPYHKKSISDLDEAFMIAEKSTNFRHVLISGGTPRITDEDYKYLNDVYKYFGEKYGEKYEIDIMLVPRGLTPKDNNEDGYKEFLETLKSWKISSLAINIELYNDEKRKELIPSKNGVGQDNYTLFMNEAVKIFGKGNVRSCIIVGIEDIEDTLKGVHYLASLGVNPVLSPYVPIDESISSPTPEFMKSVLLESEKIVSKYGITLGPKCDYCKHNTINFK